MTLEDLEALMRAPSEHEGLEFKAARTQVSRSDLWEYAVALANEGGGLLVLGVTNELPRQVVGTSAIGDPERVKHELLQKLRFRVDIEVLSHPGGRVVVLRIPPRPRGTPREVDGRYLMRSGESIVAMSPDRLKAIFDEGEPDWLTESAAKDLSGERVVELLDTQGLFELYDLPYPADRKPILDRLVSKRIIREFSGTYVISNLGALLFARRLDEFDDLARCAPRVIVYEGESKLKTRLDREGVRGYAVGFKNLVGFVMDQLPGNEVVETVLRREVKMFPVNAVRELVANALIHQDLLMTGTAVTIEIYSNRLEVSSPGRPFIPLERFIDENRSRNEGLATIMREVGICEEKGSGVDKVVQAAEIYQLPPPDFAERELHTVATMFAHKPFNLMSGAERVRACYQHCCLRFVFRDTMSNASLRERFKLPDSKTVTVSQIIKQALEAGLIKAEDPSNRSPRYARYVPIWA